MTGRGREPSGATLLGGFCLGERVSGAPQVEEPGAEQLARDGAGQHERHEPPAEAEREPQHDDEGDRQVDRDEPLPGEACALSPGTRRTAD